MELEAFSPIPVNFSKLCEFLVVAIFNWSGKSKMPLFKHKTLLVIPEKYYLHKLRLQFSFENFAAKNVTLEKVICLFLSLIFYLLVVILVDEYLGFGTFFLGFRTVRNSLIIFCNWRPCRGMIVLPLNNGATLWPQAARQRLSSNWTSLL